MTDDEKRELFRRAEDKQLIKDAIKEWLDDQFKAFGKWSAIGIASALFYVLAKAVTSSGWWPN